MPSTIMTLLSIISGLSTCQSTQTEHNPQRWPMIAYQEAVDGLLELLHTCRYIIRVYLCGESEWVSAVV